MTATAVPKSDIGQQRYRHSRSAAMGMHSPASTEPLNSNTNPLFQEVTLFSGSPRSLGSSQPISRDIGWEEIEILTWWLMWGKW